MPCSPNSGGGEQPPKKKARVQRESLLQFDHLSVQGLNPRGVSAVGTCSLEKLWALCKQGNKAVAYHTNWASPKFRQGVRVSQVAGALLQSFKRLRGDHYKKALNDDICNKKARVIAVVEMRTRWLVVVVEWRARQVDVAIRRQGCFGRCWRRLGSKSISMVELRSWWLGTSSLVGSGCVGRSPRAHDTPPHAFFLGVKRKTCWLCATLYG